MTEAEESERRQEEASERIKVFIDALDVDDVIAHLMVAEGFSSIEEIAETKIDDLVNIEVDIMAKYIQNLMPKGKDEV